MVFVNGIYGLTKPIAGIFEGIFAQGALPSINATAIFEPATLIALVVVALITWILQKIFQSCLRIIQSEKTMRMT